MMFAQPRDMEPGQWFRSHPFDPPMRFGGCDPIESRFPGKHRVRVLVTEGGRSFIADVTASFQVINFTGGK